MPASGAVAKSSRSKTWPGQCRSPSRVFSLARLSDRHLCVQSSGILDVADSAQCQASVPEDHRDLASARAHVPVQQIAAELTTGTKVVVVGLEHMVPFTTG